jgi:hypothetical protein
MQRAEAATKAGHSARAIRLLGRVLELEKDQKQARSMLSRLRTRERTVRRLMVGGASLIGTAAISGGAVLLYMIPPTEENLPREDRTHEQLVPTKVRAPDKPAPTTTPVIDPPPVPDPVPRKGPVTPVSKIPIKSIAQEARCSLKFTGMPVAVIGAGGHNYKIGSETGRALKEAVIQLAFAGESAQIQVNGAMYKGLLTVQRRQCVPGATIELEVAPKPAKFTFTGDPENTTVRCKSGPCPDNIFHLLSAEEFPAINVTEIDTQMEFEIKAEGYQSKIEKLRVHPGQQTFVIRLTKNNQR